MSLVPMMACMLNAIECEHSGGFYKHCTVGCWPRCDWIPKHSTLNSWSMYLKSTTDKFRTLETRVNRNIIVLWILHTTVTMQQFPANMLLPEAGGGGEERAFAYPHPGLIEAFWRGVARAEYSILTMPPCRFSLWDACIVAVLTGSYEVE